LISIQPAVVYYAAMVGGYVRIPKAQTRCFISRKG
jgi:hypothetical protein